MSVAIAWREVALPAFGVPEELPAIPRALYEARCRRAYAAAGADWLIVYGDREHYANLTYLTGFDPRFEEAILLLGAGERRVLLVGNEGLGYVGQAGLPVEAVLCQSLSLPGQDRTLAPRLADVLCDAGLRAGERFAVVGWKYLEPGEWTGALPAIVAPATLVDTLRDLAGDPGAVTDATAVLMGPVDGLRARAEAEQIAAFEWAAARASAAVLRIARAARPGLSELATAAAMGYAGEPLACHVMCTGGRGEIVGLRSPTARPFAHGDGVSAAVGYWGGLCARAGLLAEQDDDFLRRLALPYYGAIATWYAAIGVGAIGGAIHEGVAAALAGAGVRSALNPGHLGGLEEWVNSPIRPGSADRLASGMLVQCDIIPTPVPHGWAINGEDPIVLADAALRDDLARRFPAVWARTVARRRFMRDELGLTVGDDVLPLSTMPGYLAPLWLSPSRVLTVE